MTYKLCFFSFVCFFLVFFPARVHSQEFDDDFYISNLNKKKYALDTTAGAIVLYEKGTARFVPVANGYKMSYKVRRIINILDTTGNRTAKVRQYYPNSVNNPGQAMNISGTTYRLASNKLVKTELDKNAVKDEKTDKYNSLLSLVMPAATEGCIIDYQFEILSAVYHVMPFWKFQEGIPKLSSEYEVVAPVAYRFNSLIQGGSDFKKYDNEKAAEADHAASYEIISPATEERYSMHWVRKNIAALIDEPVITLIENHCESIELQMSGYNQENIYASWRLFDKDLLTDTYFGEQLLRSNKFLNKLVDSLVKNEQSAIQKARNIFYYVSSHIKCTSYHYVSCDRGIRDAFDSVSGDNAEINLLLVAMLRKAGLTARPLLLSKAGHLQVTTKFPLSDRFNFVACVADIEGQQYLLDATFPYNKFGELPAYCYNGTARIVDEDGSFLLLPPYKIVLRCNYNVDISRVTDSSYEMSIRERYSSFKAANLRYSLQTDSLKLRKFAKDYTSLFRDSVRIISTSVDNLTDLEKDLVIKYTFELSRQRGDSVDLAAYLIKLYKTNPFVASVRKLPIEFPYRFDLSYTLNVLVPNDFRVVALPSSSTMNAEDNGMAFDHATSYDTVAGVITVKSRLLQNGTTFPATDYEHVKSFIDKYIEEQNKRIVLKKSRRP